MSQFISATEKIYRELSRPRPPQPQPACATTEVKPITLSRADVIAIASHGRTASAEELQYILDHVKELSVTKEERAAVSLSLNMLMAQRARGGFRNDPAAKFLSQTLGFAETPWGLIERAWIHEHMRAGAEAVQRCRHHLPPLCQCWSATRAILYQASAGGPKTPEAWAATQIYSFLEQLELASRPERRENTAPRSDYEDGHYPDMASRFRWHTSTDSQ
jgi:hypothetical protein